MSGLVRARAMRGAWAAAVWAAAMPAVAEFGTMDHGVTAYGTPDARPAAPDAAGAAAEVTDPRAARARRDPTRLAWLAAGEAALQRGQSGEAQQAFERAAGLLHAADSELGLVHAALQAGHYREALAFCAHTAGSHAESAAPAALYAWLLAAGGSGDFARRVLAQARARAPDDALLVAAQAQLAAGFGSPTPSLLAAPHHLAPYAIVPPSQVRPPDGARVGSGALLLADGQHALAPWRALDGSRVAWVRNGLGRTVSARVENVDATTGVAVLALGARLPPPGPAFAAGAPVAGQPAFAIAYAPQSDAAPAWPWLFRGFIGRVSARDDRQALGIAVPPQADGIVLVDANGSIAGMGLRADDGSVRLVSVARGQGFAGMAAGPASNAQAAPTRPAADEVYERVLGAALQLIVPAARDP